MKTDDLNYIEDLRTSAEQGRSASAEAVGELLRIVDDLRQTVSEVCAERDAANTLLDLEQWQAGWQERAEQAEAERDELLAQLRGIDHKAMADTLERSNAVIAQYKAERDALQAWKDAVPLLEIDIVCTDQLVKNEWEGRCAIIEEWLDVVRTRFEYLSDADRRKVLATLDGAR